MSETIFSKIINKEVQADIVYEDELVLAFNDISPQAPTHILVIPKKVISKLDESLEEDQKLLGHLLYTAKKIMGEAKIENFRIIINNGSEAGQTVFHLHLHILAGRTFGWPPG